MSIFSWDGISEEDLRKEYDLYLRENSPTASPYYNQDLIVNMDYIGINNNKANKQGWERNAKKYWEAMLERYPNAFSSSNRFLIENYDELKVSPKCDQTFIDYFGVNEYTQNIGQVLVHHHIGQNGQVVAIPKGWHEGGENAAIHRIEYNLGVTHNAEKHSDKVQEALDANYIQSGNDVWCELKNGTELRTIAKNKFEYIQALESNDSLVKKFPGWGQYSSNAQKMFELKQLEFSTRDARTIFESGKATLDVFYETYKGLKEHLEFSDYLSARLPGTDSIMQKYNFLTTDTPNEVIEKIQLSEYKLQIAPEDNLLMLLIDKNAVPYDLFDASVETLPMISSNPSLIISMTEFLNLPTIAEMSTLYPQFAQLTALEQLQARQIAGNINMLPTEVAPVANQNFLTLYTNRFSNNGAGFQGFQNFCDFLKIYQQLPPKIQTNNNLWRNLYTNQEALTEAINTHQWDPLLEDPVSWKNMTKAADNLKTYSTIKSGIKNTTEPVLATLMIADMLNIFINATYEFSKGDLESGLEIIQDWGCNTGGAFLCATSSSLLLEATLGNALICLAATGPIGVVAALIISIGVPIVTTIAFSDEASEFLNLLGETINDSFVEGNFGENWHAGMNSLSDPNFWRGLVKDASGKIVNFPENWWNMWEDVGSNLYDLPENWWDCWENAGEKIYDLIHNIKNGTSSDDEIHGGNNNDQIFGFEGNDRLYGKNGNDILDGGAGNDRLEGGSGDDTYIYGKGYGNDVIYDYQGTNKIKFVGLSPSDMTVFYPYYTNDAVLTVTGTGETLTIQNFRSSQNYSNFVLEFDDGTVMNPEDENSPFLHVVATDAGEKVITFFGNSTVHALDGDDTVHGSGGNDEIYGEGGNDTIYGNNGNDILDGGTGNDRLEGGSGDDTYIYGKGYGNDVIYDYQGANKIKFVGLSPSDMTVFYPSQNSNAVLIITETGETLTIQNFRSSQDYRNFVLEFDGGIVMNPEDENSPFLHVVATDAGEKVITFFGNSTVHALDGDDALYGNDGNDILDGGTGNDSLNGGNGEDTYIFAKGYAQDTINEWGSDHSIVELTDINSDEITVSDQYGSNLIISVNGTDDVLTISNFKWGQSTFTFKFADGAEGYVDKETWQLVITKQPDLIEEDTEQMGAELLESLYEDDAFLSDFLTEDSTVIDDVTESAPLNEESDDIADMTDIQAMLLAENMSAFGDESQVSDSMDMTDMTADTFMTDSLLVGSLQ